uniref:Uncharacterized protein n=1 Tax=Rhizophora mucronata TaxID=61149 RepID=A0A2P2QZ02_RHIMU
MNIPEDKQSYITHIDTIISWLSIK